MFGKKDVKNVILMCISAKENRYREAHSRWYNNISWRLWRLQLYVT